LDDHPGVLRQVAELLPAGFEVVATLNNAAALPAAMDEHHPDLVVLDITMPGASGIELTSELRRTGHPVKVVFLTVHDDADYVRAGFAAGANGYVVKTRLATDLLPALEAALQNRRFVSKGAALDGLHYEEWNGETIIPNESASTK